MLSQPVAQQAPDLPFARIAPDANDNMSGIRRGLLKSENDFGIVCGSFAISGCKHLQRRVFLARNIRRDSPDIWQPQWHDL
jgi:hypothetical protein